MQKDTALYVGTDCGRQNRLGGHLQSLGIDLHKASSVSFAKQKIYENKYDLLLIQFEPVKSHIYDFCTFTRSHHYQAVIMVLMSAAKPVIESKLFDCGVDDIAVGKQTHPSALKSRIKRRLISRLSVPRANKVMLKGGAVVDIDRREVMVKGKHYKFKGVQYKLLQYFLENPHRAISKAELLNSHIWDNSVSSPNKREQGRAIDMAVTRLRRLIEADPSNPQIITTVYGTGWVLSKDAVL